MNDRGMYEVRMTSYGGGADSEGSYSYETLGIKVPDWQSKRAIQLLEGVASVLREDAEKKKAKRAKKTRAQRQSAAKVKP